MAEDAASERPWVVLGFDASWGFAPGDQTSPALAAAAGALPDIEVTSEAVTELRIHGVQGSNGPTILEHPQALQVAGDSVASFYRRWSPDGPGRPSVPWRLEAYSWGGLTKAPLRSASWLLMAPFMMYNVAYFMLPPGRLGSESGIALGPVPHLARDRGHWGASVLLRLLALAATVQLTSTAATVLISTVAWQAAGRPGALPSWMGWYGEWTAGWRVVAALAALAAMIAALFWGSVITAGKYEARTTAAQASLDTAWPLTQSNFWRGQVLVGRQRALHAAAACASAALIAALPGGHLTAVRWAAIALAASALAASAFLIASPFADRHRVTLARGGDLPGGSAARWCSGVLATALAALLVTAAVSGWTDRRHGPQTGALPGLTGFLLAQLAVQTVLLGLLAISVVVLARRAPMTDSAMDDAPYLSGRLAVFVVLTGLLWGGLLTAVVDFGVSRLFGTPVPSGFRFTVPSPDTLVVPWPAYACGAAPAGLLVGATIAVIMLYRRYRRRRDMFQTSTMGPSLVAQAYASSTAGSFHVSADEVAYDENRRVISGTWAAASMVDDAGAATMLTAIGGLLAVLAASLAAALTVGSAGHPTRLADWWHGLASLITVITVVVTGGLVTMLRQAYADPAKRKVIGALWDVATFWPRAVHPFAPPCYAERAVPEIVDRVRLLTGCFMNEPKDAARLHAEAGSLNRPRTQGLTVPAGPVLLTGYSQGAIIAAAVVAQLPSDALPEVALLTLACPLRRPYGRAFPAYFGRRQLAALACRLEVEASDDPPTTGQPGRRWKNLCRRSDYIGSWVFGEPRSQLSRSDLEKYVDQLCLDPVVLVPDDNPTPPPVHRHSQWWQDPRTGAMGAYLVDLLAEPTRAHPLPAVVPEVGLKDRADLIRTRLSGEKVQEPTGPKRTIIGLLAVAATALGLAPAAFSLHSGWLLPYLLAVSVLVVAPTARGLRLSSPTRATVPEFFLAGLDVVFLPALLGCVWVGLYYLALLSVRLIGHASGSSGNAHLIAFAGSLTAVAVIGPFIAWFITRDLGSSLYPRWGGSRTKYFYMTLLPRALLNAAAWTVALLVSVGAAALATSSWRSMGVWVVLSVYLLVASVAVKPLPGHSTPEDPRNAGIQAICSALAALGQRVVANPRTGDPAVDPFVQQLDLFSYSDEHAYAVEIKYGSSDAEPLDWTAGASVLEAARALMRAKLTETSAVISPLIIMLDTKPQESLLSFCRGEEVSLININRAAGTSEVVGSDQAELRDIARRCLELIGQQDEADQVAAEETRSRGGKPPDARLG